MIGFDAAAIADRMTAGIEIFDPGFPRDLGLIAPLTMPISATIVPSLTTADVEETLRAMTGRASRRVAKRRLRGCLIAHRGCGLIFLDADADDLLRFAVAHEVAHFTGHYLIRREIALARLGADILSVLDGERDATPTERLGGILAGCPLGIFTDVMERDGASPLSRTAERMEFEADEAAFLALAPVGTVIARTLEAEGKIDQAAVIAVLIDQFGLAHRDAARHAPRIVTAVARSRPTLIDQLRSAASNIARDRHR